MNNHDIKYFKVVAVNSDGKELYSVNVNNSTLHLDPTYGYAEFNLTRLQLYGEIINCDEEFKRMYKDGFTRLL